MEQIYDFIIIGAGPAGCFCGIELAKAGMKVCILEKHAENARKVCGDGINAICTEVLQRMDFPMERLTDEGAVPIMKYHIYREGALQSIDLTQEHKTVYGLPRNKTDLVFQRYASEEHHVAIYYNTNVQDIISTDGIYMIGNFCARRIVIAAGVYAPVMLNGIPLYPATKDRPVGVSMIVKGKKAAEPFFLFDYDASYHGTYAWIFCIGEGIYNAGIWLKEDKAAIRDKMEHFMQERAAAWIGAEYEVMVPLKGALMGIGDPVASPQPGIYLIGDAANSSNPADGEGISRAIVAAKELTMQILNTIRS
ncbi:FAD-dependent monooxygenase [Ruminococcus sp.]|uniref:FAD-dependent monooxygenase n=1 Tax=Ruminococcus sp. TaxID=41978 RepID=UPI002E76E91E|nr:FAD-dependent monooxygenase [Ruminococcus sp.]MEE1396883.1 FAD-dependent monooxygenase [Ruminococcus sp.]